MNNRIIAALAVVAIGGVGVWYFANGRTETVRPAGAALASVRVPQLSAEAVEGEAIFNDKCASCHGANAAGQDGVAPPLVHVLYEPNHHSDAAFYMAAQRGARAHHWPFGDMPPVAGVGEDDVAKILTYVRTLQRANGIY